MIFDRKTSENTTARGCHASGVLSILACLYWSARTMFVFLNSLTQRGTFKYLRAALFHFEVKKRKRKQKFQKYNQNRAGIPTFFSVFQNNACVQKA